MPPSKDSYNKSQYSRSYSSSSNNGMTMSAKVYHPATNLMPLTPPQSPTGMPPNFSTSRPNTTTTWGRQNSYNGKYS